MSERKQRKNAETEEESHTLSSHSLRLTQAGCQTNLGAELIKLGPWVASSFVDGCELWALTTRFCFLSFPFPSFFLLFCHCVPFFSSSFCSSSDSFSFRSSYCSCPCSLFFLFFLLCMFRVAKKMSASVPKLI